MTRPWERRSDLARRALRAGLAGLLLGAAPAAAFDDAAGAAVLDFSHQQVTATWSKAALPATPKAALASGAWTTVAAGDAVGWTQGFFPGILWNLYAATGDPAWRARADAWTRALEVQETNTQTHDLGFKMVPSFVRGWALTGDPYYRDVAVAAARSLATRYRATPGIVVCCDWNPAWQRPLVVDTMVNLELLLWAAGQPGGDPAWTDLALAHARTTGRDLVRADGSTFHVADYDARTGALRFQGTFQGAADGSTWSRGQAWAIAGYTLAYRYTRAPDMLALARRTAGYWVARVPASGVPNWDFDSASLHPDSSAAAAAASALLELSGYVEEPERSRYRAAAEAALDTLASSAYLAKGTGFPSILRRAVGNLPAGSEVDVGLVYGDHYFLEAVRRRVPGAAPRWTAALEFGRALRRLGPGNGGVRTIEVDVTPRASPIDALVGWADASRTVAAYGDLAMIVRMSPAGVFDVRNGGVFAAEARVPYVGGATYHVRVVADLGARRYSAWVTPPGAAEVRLASGYAFRTTAADADDVGQVALKAGIADGDFVATNYRMSAGATATRWVAALSFGSAMHALGSGNGGVRTIEYDVTPRASPIDGVVGWADSSRTVAAYGDLAMLVRLSPAGVFDVRNGDVFAAANRVPYAGGATYHVRVVADMGARRYSAWVRPPGGSEVQLASGYAFRTTASTADDVGQVATKAGVADGDFFVENHRVLAGAAAATAMTAALEEPGADRARVGCGGEGATLIVGAALVARRAGRRDRTPHPDLLPAPRGAGGR